MLQSLAIRNYQSIAHVDIELGPLTVIVGASSVGKSAFTRAVKLLTSNALGTSFIRHGQQVCTVTAVTDRGTVTLKRGKGADEYVTIPADPDQPQRSFTKLGGKVPEEVTEFIGIEPRDPINYAGQFDRPFMLDETGNTVARTLGALTGVNVVFEAAAESRRQQLASTRTLKDRSTMLDDTLKQAETFRPLKEQIVAQERAEEAFKRAEEAEARLALLDAQVGILRVASTELKAIDPLADATLPTDAIARARETQKKIDRLDSIIDEIRLQGGLQRTAEEAYVVAADEIVTMQSQYIDLLTEAGQCPVCGQDTKHLEHA